MGLANAQRSLEIIRTLTQFLVQPEYAPVVPLWGFVNEPNAAGENVIGQGPIGSFYYEVYRMIREITGTGEGNGPMLSMHDGFLGMSSWYDFMPGADRMALDQHPYMCFGDQNMGALSAIAETPCNAWAVATNTTSRRFGANSAGEWSAAVNDCGKWLNRVGVGARYENAFPGYTGPTGGTGACDYWNDHTQWTDDTKAELLNVVTRSMDALQVSFRSSSLCMWM
jgi:glucan 1,3-beta-glucosidase